MEPEQPSLKTPCPATVHMALAISPWAPCSPTVPVITVMGKITHAMFISLLTLPGGDRGGTKEQREKPKLSVSPVKTPAPLSWGLLWMVSSPRNLRVYVSFYVHGRCVAYHLSMP